MSVRRVLVVDDHPVNRTLVCVLLRDAGWHVEEAVDGHAGLAKLAAGTFDTVLLDISMPDISGDEVCRRIRADGKLKTLRVIAYTAHALDNERDKILSAGFDGLLTKPISKASLFAALQLPEKT
jgi:two-component system chemotaxis response regulator CheY